MNSIISTVFTLALGIISGVISTVIYDKYKRKHNLSTIYKSKYTGTWSDEIYNREKYKSGEKVIEKRDIFELKHNKDSDEIMGTIKRVYPPEQNRNWQFTGIIDGETIILTFWTRDLVKSKGCVYVTHVDDNIYEGYYLEKYEEEIVKTPIRLKKDK